MEGRLMPSLEHRIPPPAIALLVALAMWSIALVAPRFALSPMVRIVAALAIALAGIAISTAGAATFRRAKTTLNPITPEAASVLVTHGIFRLTRNPMYVGLGLVLIAWALFLASAFAFLGPVLFVLYIDRFQIAPEERALTALFGPSYAAYRRDVRRWL
jgi:protein-S-isoprenylcysteine O-methyltransferase Ste14